MLAMFVSKLQALVLLRPYVKQVAWSNTSQCKKADGESYRPHAIHDEKDN